MKARVHVTLKQGVLDPQGRAVADTLDRLGFSAVEDVRVGKVIEIDFKDQDVAPQEAEGMVEDMCEQLLANTVIEAYRVEIV